MQLRDVLLDLIAKNESVSLRVDVASLLSQATLDIIGKAGFGLDFASLDITKPRSELTQAFSTLFKGTNTSRLFVALRTFMPWMRHLVSARYTPICLLFCALEVLHRKLIQDSLANRAAKKAYCVEKDHGSRRQRSLGRCQSDARSQ